MKPRAFVTIYTSGGPSFEQTIYCNVMKGRHWNKFVLGVDLRTGLFRFLPEAAYAQI